MKHIFSLIALLFFCNLLSAHDIHYNNAVLHEWTIKNTDKSLFASYCMSKNGEVFLQKKNSEIVKLSLKDLSEKDQLFVQQRLDKIETINSAALVINETKVQPGSTVNTEVLVILLCLGMAMLTFYIHRQKKQLGFLVLLVCGGIIITVSAFTQKTSLALSSATSPSFLDSSFTPFRPHVNTYTSGNYYYVESLGIPSTHTMMVGISNRGWQQQVPVPQCYIGANAWPIPLNPVVSNSAIPVDSSHFIRGAIAVAVNGVPIFNVYTNTGVDSYLDGQLDTYGGHCGRADDYHYHIAPLHLYNYTSQQLPIAFALDGYAVYGSKEPNGTNMTALDINHGHFGSSGVYHYHGTAAAPYMIAKMVGQVTEDATKQIIPQASATAVRPPFTPLNGALITACTPNATKTGYTLKYVLNSVTDSIVYSWNNLGKYTFTYYKASGVTTSTYNGFTPCVVKVTTDIKTEINSSNDVLVYPNPTSNLLHVILNQESTNGEIQTVSIYNLEGQLILRKSNDTNEINLDKIPPGTYFIQINQGLKQVTKKLIIQ